MATHSARGLVLLLTLITLVAGERCRVPVPFNSDLVGRRFTRYDECYRKIAVGELRVNAKTIFYKPSYVQIYPIDICDEMYVFHFRSGRNDPFVVYFPETRVPNKFTSTIEVRAKFCEREYQKVREKYFPVGNTRKRFKEAVRAIVKGAIGIRDFDCTYDLEGFPIQVPGRAFKNVDLDGIVTYLLGVAYQYNFCAEPAMDESV